MVLGYRIPSNKNIYHFLPPTGEGGHRPDEAERGWG